MASFQPNCPFSKFTVRKWTVGGPTGSFRWVGFSLCLSVSVVKFAVASTISSRGLRPHRRTSPPVSRTARRAAFLSFRAKRGICFPFSNPTATHIDIHRYTAPLECPHQSHRHSRSGRNCRPPLRRITLHCPSSLPGQHSRGDSRPRLSCGAKLRTRVARARICQRPTTRDQRPD